MTYVHYEDKEDLDKQAFDDLLNTFRLKQWVNCISHEAGHTLDSIITQINGDLNLSEPEQGWNLSDHWLIKTSLEENKPKYKKMRTSFCKTKLLEDKGTTKQLLENIVKKWQESASED